MQLIEPRQAEFGRYCEDNLAALPRRPHGRPIFPWTACTSMFHCNSGSTAARVQCRAVKRRGVLAETWSSWYWAERNISVEGVRTRLLKRIRSGTIAGIFLSPPSHTCSRGRRGEVDSGWPIAVCHDSFPEGFSWLEGSVREAVCRANFFFLQTPVPML